jgi:diguanylate cyclase (GGDEF)-like protein
MDKEALVRKAPAISPEHMQLLDAHVKQCGACQRESERCAEQDAALQKTYVIDAKTVTDFKEQVRAKILGPAPISASRTSLLVVDDEPGVLGLLQRCLMAEFDVLTAADAGQAEKLFDQHRIDMVLTDNLLPNSSGVELLEWVMQHHPRTIRLLMTGGALATAIEAINRGKIYHYLVKPCSAQEWLPVLRHAADKSNLERKQEELLDQLRGLKIDLEERVLERTAALQEANQELRQKNKMLMKLALTDVLTGLPNRRAMVRLAEQELRRRDRYPSALGIGMIDVDHFKDINTRLQHSGGDKILADLAKCLQSSLRTVDFVGRVGGEEFLVIAPETNLQGFSVLGERIRGLVERHPFMYQDKVVKVTVSLGFAVADAGVPADYCRMKEAAEAALLRAKDNGRNRLELCRLSACTAPPPPS